MSKNLIPNPDWSIFRDHTDSCLLKDDPKFDSKMIALTNFTCLPDDMRAKRLDKVIFDTVDAVPPCIKYHLPCEVKLINSTPIFGKILMTPINVNIMSLINIDHDHFLDLHPVRYDKVKEAISIGEIDMPLVSICDDGFPRVGDGRHRIIAMYKYGFINLDILVPEDQVDRITRQLPVGVKRKPSTVEFQDTTRVFSIENFIV